jgi:hypothetical protein
MGGQSSRRAHTPDRIDFMSFQSFAGFGNVVWAVAPHWSDVCITEKREEQAANQLGKENAMRTKTNVKAGHIVE